MRRRKFFQHLFWDCWFLDVFVGLEPSGTLSPHSQESKCVGRIRTILILFLADFCQSKPMTHFLWFLLSVLRSLSGSGWSTLPPRRWSAIFNHWSALLRISSAFTYTNSTYSVAGAYNVVVLPANQQNSAQPVRRAFHKIQRTLLCFLQPEVSLL